MRGRQQPGDVEPWNNAARPRIVNQENLQDTGYLMAVQATPVETIFRQVADQSPAPNPLPPEAQQAWTDEVSRILITGVALREKAAAYSRRLAATVRDAVAAGVPKQTVADACGTSVDQVDALAHYAELYQLRHPINPVATISATSQPKDNP